MVHECGILTRMAMSRQPLLSKKKRYLQIALNGSLSDALSIIQTLPRSDRIILEAGTPLIKRYGEKGIADIVTWYGRHLAGQPVTVGSQQEQMSLKEVFDVAKRQYREYKANPKGFARNNKTSPALPYVVADLKMMDRGATEVAIAHRAGASAAVALGHAPTESLDAFVAECEARNLDSMIDMMNVDFPLAVLDKLSQRPDVVILHRGVDETERNKEKQLPLHEIRRVKGRYDTLIAVAGGDTMREVQSTVFNDADIAVVWKDFYSRTRSTGALASEFLRQIK